MRKKHVRLLSKPTVIHFEGKRLEHESLKMDAALVLVVALLALLAYLLYRLRNFTASNNAALGETAVPMKGPLQGLRLKPANKGVSSSFSPSPSCWWLQGERLDTSELFPLLGSDGIRQISAAFYNRVYDDNDDENKWFTDLFKKRATLQQSIDRQAAFFSQMFGEPAKPYTSTNTPHCLRSVVGDHAGAKMFVMHHRSRDAGEITEETALKWWQHMDRALAEDLRPVWKAKHGEELGHAVEKAVRWFTDHVLERMVWGAPTKSAFTIRSVMFRLFTSITKRFVTNKVAPASVVAKAATTLQLPPAAACYKRLPASGTFTVATMPRGLLSRHNTKENVWGEINVVKGRLQLNQLEGIVEEVVLDPNAPTGGIGVVAPQQYHVVKPLSEDVEMFVKFCKVPSATGRGEEGEDAAATQNTNSGVTRRRRDKGFG